MSDGVVRSLLFQALGSPYGMRVQVHDVAAAQQVFGQVRARMAEPQLAQLSFRRPPNGEPGVLWIVKSAGKGSPSSHLPAASSPESTSEIDAILDGIMSKICDGP